MADLQNVKILEQGIVSRMTEGLFRYQAWPTVAKDRAGRIYVICSGHRLGHLCPFGKNLMYKSEDEGHTWSCPTIVNDSCLDDRDGGILAFGENKLLISWFNHGSEFYFGERDWVERNTDPVTHDMSMGLLNGWKSLPPDQDCAGSYVKLSPDGGCTWSGRVKVPVSSPHGPTLLSDGRLLYVGKEFHSDRPEKGQILVYSSSDCGMNWEMLSQIELPEGCSAANVHEPHAVELPDGRIIAGIRGQGKEVPNKFTVYTAFSDDKGASWSSPECLGICGSPPHFLSHSSGALILTYGKRTGPMGEYAIISYDNGKTFGEEIQLCEAFDKDLGYPSTVELSDGSLLTVYYQKAKGDRYCSILYTKWRLN